MKKPPFKGLVIRTGAVIKQGSGYIYACDPKKERKHVPHALVFRFKDGNFTQGECNYDASSVCRVLKPDSAIVDISESGYYTYNSKAGPDTADLFQTSQPPPPEKRSMGLRSVSEIASKAYAVGIRGLVYRLDHAMSWTRIDDGLPRTFD